MTRKMIRTLVVLVTSMLVVSFSYRDARRILTKEQKAPLMRRGLSQALQMKTILPKLNPRQRKLAGEK